MELLPEGAPRRKEELEVLVAQEADFDLRNKERDGAGDEDEDTSGRDKDSR